MTMDQAIRRRTLVSALGLGAAAFWLRPAAARDNSASEPSKASQDEPAPAYVTFEMQVTWPTVIALQTRMSNLLDKNVKEIHLLISSTGGDIGAAVTGYNFLKAMSVPLFTYNLGDVESAAVVLFLAGQTRTCSPASRFLFHQARSHIKDEDLSIAEYRDDMQDLQTDIDRLKAIYVARTKIDDKTAEDLLSRQHWVDPRTAVDLGVVEAIEPLKIPANAAVSVLPVPD